MKTLHETFLTISFNQVVKPTIQMLFTFLNFDNNRLKNY